MLRQKMWLCQFGAPQVVREMQMPTQPAHKRPRKSRKRPQVRNQSFEKGQKRGACGDQYIMGLQSLWYRPLQTSFEMPQMPKTTSYRPTACGNTTKRRGLTNIACISIAIVVIFATYLTFSCSCYTKVHSSRSVGFQYGVLQTADDRTSTRERYPGRICRDVRCNRGLPKVTLKTKHMKTI